MTTYYARHTSALLLDKATRDRLWRERRIAVHYPFTADQLPVDWAAPSTWPASDTDSLTTADYDLSGKRAIGALLDLARGGGYVCAEYSGETECLVGRVLPDSEIELIEGRWWDGHRPAILKSLRLHDARAIPREQQAVLLAGRPRQGTLLRWPRVGSLVETLVEGRTSEPSLAMLSPPLQEAMCAEYLRTHDDPTLPRLAALVLPVGGTLRDLDIVGLATDGRQLLGQVTHQHIDESRVKLDRLDECTGSDNVGVLFCRCVNPSEDRTGLIVYPIERAFSRFLTTELGQQWYRAAQHLSGFPTEATAL